MRGGSCCRPCLGVSKQSVRSEPVTEKSGRHPSTGDPVLQVWRDVPGIHLVVLGNESQLTQLSLKLSEAVDMEGGGPVGWEGPRDHGPVFKGGDKAVDGGGFGFGFVRAWRRKVAKPGLVIVVAGFVGDGKHALHVILAVGLFHARVVPGRNQGSQSLELMFLMASVVGRVRRRGQETGSRLVQATQVKGGLEPHVGFGREVAQVAEILDKGASCPVGKDVVDARRVGALSDAVPVEEPPVCVFEMVWGAFGDVGPPVLEHVEEVWVAVDVGIGIHTDEVGGGPDSGGSAISKTKNVGAVPSRATVNAGDVDACRAVVVSSPPTLALGAERLEHLVPALGSLEARYT